MHMRAHYSEDTDSITVQLDFNSTLVPDSRLTFGTDNFRSTSTSGAQPLVARARAPVCLSLATPLRERSVLVSSPDPTLLRGEKVW